MDVCIGQDGEVVSPGATLNLCENSSGGNWYDTNYDISDSLCLQYSGGDSGYGLWIPE